MPIFGIDISKHKLDVAWLKEPETRKVKPKVFPNTPTGYEQLLAWAIHNAQCPLSECCFAMEATGVYHERLAMRLYEQGAQVIVANPQHVSHYGKGLGVKTKTDKRDSFIIAHYAYATHPPLWQPEPGEIRQLKALIGRLEAIEKTLQQERNRLEKAEVSQAPEVVIDSIKQTTAYLVKEKRDFEQQIEDHLDQHSGLKQDKTLLESIPGVGTVIASRVITVMHGHRFHSAAQAAAYCGLVPIEKESGISLKKKPRLSKVGSAQFRAKLYMASLSATKHNPLIRAHYLQLIERGKSKMAALGAAMRKLIHICFGVLKHQQPFSTTFQQKLVQKH